MKAKQSQVAKATGSTDQVEITSLKQAGYGFAKTGHSRRTIAAFVYDKVPTFLDTVPDEAKADLYAGFELSYHELQGQDYYALGDTGTLIKVANSKDPDFANRKVHDKEIILSVHYVRSFSQQEYGKLKEKDPQLYGVVKPMREAFIKYASNAMGDIRTEIKRLIAGDNPKTRSANKAFVEWVTDMLSTADDRAKTAAARGDETANQVKFRVARDAFWKAYNAK